MDEAVVIVGDDNQGRAALGIALADQGYVVHFCRTTTEATTLVTDADVGVLLVDCANMPVDDGLRLARECRDSHPHLRCLVICNADDWDPVDDWLHVLQQPYSMVRFATKMKEIIASR